MSRTSSYSLMVSKHGDFRNERLDPFLNRVDLCVTLLNSFSLSHWIRVHGLALDHDASKTLEMQSESS